MDDSSGTTTWSERLYGAVWTPLDEDAPRWKRGTVAAARVLWTAAEGFVADSCTLRASALTLASMLALVPALAASFAVIRGLGWTGERLESLLLERATILSPQAVITVVSWVDNISIAGLGLMGALFAVASAFSVLLQLEDSFDDIWGSLQPRGMVRRTADAMAILVFGPVVLAIAATSEAGLRTSWVVGWLNGFGGLEPLVRAGFGLAWYALVCGAFTALYVFLPSAPVERRAAAIAGIVVGIIWQMAQSAYVSFQFGLDRYNAVYGVIAQIPALVLWMGLSWMIVLAGAELAAALQNMRTSHGRRAPRTLGASDRERLALAVVTELADAAYARRPAPTLAQLAGALQAPLRNVGEVFGVLAAAGLVHNGGAEQLQCFLSLSPGSVEVERVLAAVSGGAFPVAEARPAVDELLKRVAGARREALDGLTLADLVDARR